MGVNNLNSMPDYRPPQLQHRHRVELESGSAAFDDEAGGRRTLREGLTWSSSDNRSVPAARERRSEPQRLSLAAPPASLRVYMEDAKTRWRRFSTRARSFHWAKGYTRHQVTSIFTDISLLPVAPVAVLYICIPTYNEAATVGVLLWRIRAVFQDYSREYEILVYDDASSDATAETLAPYNEVLPLKVIRGEARLGYACAIEACCKEVVCRTRYPRRDAMIVMQADFTDLPEQIPELVRRFEGGADVVVADRSAANGAPKPVRRLRLLSSLLARHFTGLTGVADPFSSFRLYRVSVIKDLLSARGTNGIMSAPGLAANLQLLLSASRVARRVESVPLPASYDIRVRESRVRPVSDAVELYKFGLRSWKAPIPAGPGKVTR